jgi:hypothetical protein
MLPMGEKRQVREIMSKFSKLLSHCTVSTRGQHLVINGVDCTKARFKKEMFQLCEGSGEDSLLAELALLKVKDNSSYLLEATYAFDDLFHQYQEATQKATASELKANKGLELELVVGAEDGITRVIDMTNKRLTHIHPNAYWGDFTGKEKLELEKNTKKNTAHLYFDITDPRTYYEDEKGSHLNKYIPPEWREAEPVEGHPAQFLELLNHLFCNDKKQIEFVLDWIYRLITSRNETALVLNGPKGVGKNALHAVCKALVGIPYCSEATSKFGVKEFNDVLRDRILLLIDEHRINKDKYNFLKASFNPWQTIEVKNKAVGHTEKICVNYMIFHNSPEDIYLENSERRFSVMDITDIKLETIWSREKSDQFFQDLADPNNPQVSIIGNFILNWGASRVQDPFAVYLGAKYSEILDCHVPIVIHSIVNMIETGKDTDGILLGNKVNTNCFKLLGSKVINKGPRVKTLVKEYKYRGKYCLGEVDTSAMPWRLTINPQVIELVEKERDNGRY